MGGRRYIPSLHRQPLDAVCGAYTLGTIGVSSWLKNHLTKIKELFILPTNTRSTVVMNKVSITFQHT